ncbi:hypothetical protein MKX01_012453, partial [Papaver californicum]
DTKVEESNKELPKGSVKDLGRRSKIVLDPLDNDNNNKNDMDDVRVGEFTGSDVPRIFDAFFASLSMILISEIGDETFIIAALMAMHHPKSIVLSGALSVLFVMMVLSIGLGLIVRNLISRKHIHSAAKVLIICNTLYLVLCLRRLPLGAEAIKL